MENTELKNISYFIYHQIPNGLPQDFCRELFKKIDDLPFNHTDDSNAFDIKGKIYEYFIGRDKSAISDMGAYFTDRYLTNFIMEELSPECENGIVKLMIDMFGGSGGMTLSYVDYINRKYKPKWEYKDNYKNITHCDMSEDVVKIAAVEYFSLTNFFPNKETQFIRTNSFKHEFTQKYKYIVSNPPYGGDKNEQTPEIQKKQTIIDYNKQELEKIKINLNIQTKEFNQLIKIITLDFNNNIFNKENDIIDFEKNNLLDFKLFEEIVKNLTEKFCSTCKINFTLNKNNFNKFVRLQWQNLIFKRQNVDEIENGSKLKVNFDSCSKYIQNFSKNIIYEYNVFSRKQYIKQIDNSLLLKLNTDKLNKCKIKLQKELDTKYKTNMITTKDIEFNDKESCSLILLMNALDDDGVCIGVLKEGVFFDGKYSILRCFLINNYNITDIYSVGANVFENTTTKTSIIKFRKNGKTSIINFWDLEVIKNNIDTIEFDINNGNHITKLKDQITKVNKVKICSATYEQLSHIKLSYNINNEPIFDMKYSLNYKDYKDFVTDCPEGFELKTLGDIVECIENKTSIEDITGKYNYYTCSEKISKCIKPLNEGEYIILGSRGTIEKALHYVNDKFGCGNNMILIKSINIAS